jgi:hypothetical protein
MTDTELTTFQISKATLARIKELATADMRSGTKEIEWLLDQEIARRNNPTFLRVDGTLTGKGDEIGAVIKNRNAHKA